MTVLRRQLGTDGPKVSQITYGTMRLDPARLEQSPTQFLCELHDRGIDTHHSSHEYDSHPAYLRALADARSTGRGFQHVVKLSDPSFDDHRFDGQRFTALVENELQTLGAETLASVQWLVRTPDAQDAKARIDVLHQQRDEIIEWKNSHIASGKIQNLSVFPYAMGFAHAAAAAGITATMTTYLNLAETEAVSLLNEDAGFLALRPLAGGRLWPDGVPDDDLVDASNARAYLQTAYLSGDERIDAALRFPLLHPATTSIIVSVNSDTHVDQAVRAAGAVAADLTSFEEIRRSIVSETPSTHP